MFFEDTISAITLLSRNFSQFHLIILLFFECYFLEEIRLFEEQILTLKFRCNELPRSSFLRLISLLTHKAEICTMQVIAWDVAYIALFAFFLTHFILMKFLKKQKINWKLSHYGAFCSAKFSI